MTAGIRQRTPCSCTITVSNGRRDENGKYGRIIKTVKGSKREAEKARAEIVALRRREHAHSVELERERIDERAAALHEKMQVRAGHPPRRTDVADELPLLDVLPRMKSGRKPR